MQYGITATTFIPAGTTGYLLQAATNTATWVSTGSIVVGTALQSVSQYVTGLTALEINPTRYLTMSAGVNGFYGLGAQSDLAYNTNNKVLTVSVTTVTSSVNALSTTSGALRVVGGVGIGGNLYVGGEIVATKLTIELTTVSTTLVTTDDIIKTTNNTNATTSTGESGALQVLGGASIGQDLYVGGLIYGIVAGAASSDLATTATNLGGGTAGQVPYQTAPGLTSFYGPGTAEQIAVSRGTLGPTYVNTTSIYVGNAVNANNLIGGSVGSLVYQQNTGSTTFLTLGTAGYILSAGTTSPEWVSVSGLTAANATTATNLAGGSKGQVPYQDDIGRTLFFGPGTTGQVLVSTGGTGSPIFQSTLTVSTISVGANWLGGATGEIRADNEITAYYSSDIRLKENIKLIEDPISLINQIRGVKFDWTDAYINSRGGQDDYFVRKQDVGIIAQEIQAILPEIVATRTNGYLAVRYEKIVPLLIEAIKSLSAELDDLKNKIK
jgi:hypothetical protein